eukprot:g10473.t1
MAESRRSTRWAEAAQAAAAAGTAAGSSSGKGGGGGGSGTGGGGGGGGADRMWVGSKEKIVDEKTAEFIFLAGEKSSLSDYHKNTDADTFMQWLENRLKPAFEELFPGKKTILILDNAPYHHGMADDWKSPL